MTTIETKTPSQLVPYREEPSPEEIVPSDNGTAAGVAGVTWRNGVLSIRATVDQAKAGDDNETVMTPLRTAEAIVAQGGTLFATAAQGALADSAVQSVEAGFGISVDSTDPQHPEASVTDIPDQSVTAAKISDDPAIQAAIFNKIKQPITLSDMAESAKTDLRLVDPNGPRIPVGYYSATQVQITGVTSIAMGGFRWKGHYVVPRARSFDMPAYDNFARNIVSVGNGSSTAGNLFAEAYHAKSNWYAMFAAANDGDTTATLGFMPFLRVGTIAGSTITLNLAGENQRTISGKTYQFTTNNLVGCDVLVLTETLNSRANGFSGRLTTVTANTQTTVTLADVGAMDEYDYFLVAPPGYDHYAYMNASYIDTGELRNIADSGLYVGSRSVNNTQADISGAGTGSTMMPFDGIISPLATAVKFVHKETIASATTGSGTIRWGTDGSSHDVDEFIYYKSPASSTSYAFGFAPIPFSFHQRLWFYYSNTLNIAANTREVQIRGWVEP